MPPPAPGVYLEMPGLRVVRVPDQPDRNYRADLASWGATIARIWRGETAEQGRTLVLVGPPAPPASSFFIGSPLSNK